jgi:hypothetical protein
MEWQKPNASPPSSHSLLSVKPSTYVVTLAYSDLMVATYNGKDTIAYLKDKLTVTLERKLAEQGFKPGTYKITYATWRDALVSKMSASAQVYDCNAGLSGHMRHPGV